MTDAVGVEDDGFLTVEQLAELRRVTPAAVRAQLRAGNLAGEQVLQGQRTVWRIPMSAARGYLERSGGDRPADVRAPEPARTPPRQVEVLEAEVRRLRRQLSALTDAHHRLLDAVSADLFEDR